MTKAEKRYEWALQSLLRPAGSVPTRAQIHQAALRYQLHPAQERRLVAAIREETNGREAK